MASLSSASPLKTDLTTQILPEATTFTNSVGEIAQYYFKNNPWKLSAANDYQKVYRFCIICGDERFSSEEWSKVIDLWGPPTICKKEACWDALAFVPGFVSRKHYLIETHLDKSRVKVAHENEFFEDITHVTLSIRFDKVFSSEDEMPQEYLEIFKKLENFPVETRIPEIDSIYFDYREKNNIVVGKYMTETTDPFLKALALYRQESIKILNWIRSNL